MLKENNLILSEYSRILNDVKKSTLSQYIASIKIFERFINKPFIEVVLCDVLDFLDSLKSKKDTNASLKTKNHYLNILNQFYGYLYRTNKITLNPCIEIKPYKISKDLIDEVSGKIDKDYYLETDEITRLVKTLNNNVKNNRKDTRKYFLAYRDLILYLLMMHRGFRIGEMISLEFNQINFKERTFCITAKKSKNSTARVVSIPLDLWDIFLEYLDLRKNIDILNSQFIFLSKNGKQMTNIDTNRNLKKYMSIAKINLVKAHNHTLRHTAGTTHSLNHSIRETAALLGHKSTETTMIYSHNSKEMLKNSENNKILDNLIEKII